MPPRVDVEFDDGYQGANGASIVGQEQIADIENGNGIESAEIGSAMHPSPDGPEADIERQMIENAFKEKQISPSQRLDSQSRSDLRRKYL